MAPTLRRSSLKLLFDCGLVILAALTLWSFAKPRRPADALPPLLQPGMRLEVPSIQWPTDRNVVALISPNCAACQASTGFYRALAKQIEVRTDSALVIIASEPAPEVEAWLREHQIHASAVVTMEKPVAAGFFFVPTILTVDRDGIIRDLLAERLTPSEERYILDRVSSVAWSQDSMNSSPAPREISVDDLGSVRQSKRTVVVDIRDRHAEAGRAEGTLRIPMDELAVRAIVELPRDAAIVVDCRSIVPLVCRRGGLVLTSMGYPDVRLMR